MPLIELNIVTLKESKINKIKKTINYSGIFDEKSMVFFILINLYRCFIDDHQNQELITGFDNYQNIKLITEEYKDKFLTIYDKLKDIINEENFALSKFDLSDLLKVIKNYLNIDITSIDYNVENVIIKLL